MFSLGVKTIFLDKYEASPQTSKENSLNELVPIYDTEQIVPIMEEDAEDWKLVLVNKWNPVEDADISNIKLKNLKWGQSVDERCYKYLQLMMDDCREAGFEPMICSSYRTNERQHELFNNQMEIYMSKGMERDAAFEKTAKSVAVPGTSEHELGLAVDITDIHNQNIISGMESQPVQKWLMKNSWKYGFILRYPQDKSDITGIVYEPWHYRYVGYDAAKYIYENNLTLEEYVERLYSR